MLNPVVEEDLKAILAADLPWGNLSAKTVLITGANGFIPAYILETLLYLNDKKNTKIKILALVRNIEKAKKKFAHHLKREDLVWLVQDVCDPVRIDKVDIIIHAASQASPKFYGSDPVGTLAANTAGTSSLLQLATDKQVENFLFFSSGEVYGELSADQFPVAETVYGSVDPMLPRSCYAEGKRAGEALCAAWHHQYGVPVKVIRPFHTYGPGMALDDGRVYADFVADILAGRDIIMKSEGKARRAFCYLADMVSGAFTVLLKGKNGEAYNIGNREAELSIVELAERLVALFPEQGRKLLRRKREASQDYIESPLSRNSPLTLKAQGLGWSPTIGIDEGFLKTVRSYR